MNEYKKRKIQKMLVKGKFPNPLAYLSTQFWLLREDCLRPFQDVNSFYY